MLHRSLQHLTLCQVFHRAEQNTKQFCSKRWKKFAPKKQAPPKSEHAYDSICVCFFVVNGVNVETAIPVRTFNICQGQDVSERNLDAGEFQSLLLLPSHHIAPKGHANANKTQQGQYDSVCHAARSEDSSASSSEWLEWPWQRIRLANVS